MASSAASERPRGLTHRRVKEPSICLSPLYNQPLPAAHGTGHTGVPDQVKWITRSFWNIRNGFFSEILSLGCLGREQRMPFLMAISLRKLGYESRREAACPVNL